MSNVNKGETVSLSNLKDVSHLSKLVQKLREESSNSIDKMKLDAQASFPIDIHHYNQDMFETKLSQDVWKDKYTWERAPFYIQETHPYHIMARAAIGLYEHEMFVATPGHPVTEESRTKAYERAKDTFYAMVQGLFMPAGRILTGAGTDKHVTLMNCYVNARIEDNMQSITEGQANIMLTQQQGGGIGSGFSNIRPNRATLFRTGTPASGPIPFMRAYNTSAETVRSAGDRRAAMMGTLSITHPDIEAFVGWKSQAGELTNFNVSVLVPDSFMAALGDNEDWYLHFKIPPYDKRAPELEALDWDDDETDTRQYVYKSIPSRSLWEQITRNTYEWSEPGVLFIDTINEMNNLQEYEYIDCTNPCGEQPLPPNGACDLGALNLARMVRQPFTEDAWFDFDLMRKVARIAVRALDNAMDVTEYPLPAQRQEQIDKRRIGVGFAGLASALAQLNIRYGSMRAVKFTEELTRELCLECYRTSIALAKEKGPFRLWDPGKYGHVGFVSKQIPRDMLTEIFETGIRNSLCLTMAPTGNTSQAFGLETEAGIEPAFAHIATRKVKQPDNSWKEYPSTSYTYRLWSRMFPEKSKLEDLPKTFVIADQLPVIEHVQMQAAIQKWVDASVSKTINCPQEMPYEEFVHVYSLAYELGCKGCTTYRPSDVRGSILSKPGDKVPTKPVGRPETLKAEVMQIRWPGLSSSLYLTVSFTDDGKPYEIFLNSKDERHKQWITTVTILLSHSLRRGLDPFQITAELQQIHSSEGGAWAEPGKWFNSLVAYMGYKLAQLFTASGMTPQDVGESHLVVATPESLGAPHEIRTLGDACTNCGSNNTYRAEGCIKCKDCGDSKCG